MLQIEFEENVKFLRSLKSSEKGLRAAKKHIARLQEQNRILSEVVAEERLLRKAAWQEYWSRSRHSFMNMVFSMVNAMKSEEWHNRQFVEGMFNRINKGRFQGTMSSLTTRNAC